MCSAGPRQFFRPRLIQLPPQYLEIPGQYVVYQEEVPTASETRTDHPAFRFQAMGIPMEGPATNNNPKSTESDIQQTQAGPFITIWPWKASV